MISRSEVSSLIFLISQGKLSNNLKLRLNIKLIMNNFNAKLITDKSKKKNYIYLKEITNVTIKISYLSSVLSGPRLEVNEWSYLGMVI